MPGQRVKVEEVPLDGVEWPQPVVEQPRLIEVAGYTRRAPARKETPVETPTFPVPRQRARRTDPSTSRHAANKVKVSDQARRILHAYEHGPLLDEEAYERAGFPPGARDGQRCTDLRHAQLIAPTGEKRRTTNGAPARVCAITDAGRDFLDAPHR